MVAPPGVMQTRVIKVMETHRSALAVLQRAAGDVAMGMIVGDAANRWRVLGISTIPADAWKAGRRGVSLQPLSGSAAPAKETWESIVEKAERSLHGRPP